MNSFDQLIREIEPEMIKEGEFEAWDKKARPVELFIEADFVQLKIKSQVSDYAQLRKAILRGVGDPRIEKKISQENPNASLVELYQQVRSSVQETYFRNKIKGWFARFFTKKS